MASNSARSGAPFERTRVGVYLLVTFAVSWAVGVVVYATGGIVDSPQVVGPFSLATLLLATGYMWGPTVGNVAARLVTGEGFDDVALRPHVRESWRTWLLAWFAPIGLLLVGAALYFAVFPGQFDPSLSGLSAVLAQSGVPAGSVWTVVVLQSVLAVVISPVVNAPATFGEEFGWRGYLLPKLLPLGERRAVLYSGAIWGVWHWPVILMGYNYGFGYPGAPWTGLLAMVVFTVALGGFFAWVALRGGSVWPAVIAHGAVNGTAGLALIFLSGQPNVLLGPAPTGVLAALPWLAVTAWLCYRPDRLAPEHPGRFP
ncbi:MAG: lysostaphin resistance A-like protein [Haloferacaceae archaeon]